MADKISQQDLNRMAVRGAKVKRKASAVPTLEEVQKSAPAPAPPPAPDNSIPMASMAASSNAINQQLGNIVEHNSRVIEQFSADLRDKVGSAPKRQPWRHLIKRDRNKLIEYVDTIPIELTK